MLHYIFNKAGAAILCDPEHSGNDSLRLNLFLPQRTAKNCTENRREFLLINYSGKISDNHSFKPQRAPRHHKEPYEP